MKSKQKDQKQGYQDNTSQSVSQAESGSRQSGAKGSASIGRQEAQGGAVDRNEESRRSRSEDKRVETGRTGSRSGSRGR